MVKSHIGGWRRVLRNAGIGLGLAGALGAAQAALVNFEGFGDNFTLTNEVVGVQFNGGTVLTAGIGLNELDFPPHSGDNVLAGLSGGLTLSFDTPQTSFSGWFTHGNTLNFLGLDALNNVILSASTADVSNLGDFDQYAFLGLNLKALIITSIDGSSFVLDDLFFGANAVPEAPGWSLAALGLALLAASQRRAQARHPRR